MKYLNKKEAILVLEDGTIFYGKSTWEAIGTATGELCFNTGMTGYQEVFTDPSYYGQLMITTNAHISNYGVDIEEVESDGMKIVGLICKNFNSGYSRPRADMSLQEYFEKENKVVITDVDTRSLVKHIRDKGGYEYPIISNENLQIDSLKEQLKVVPSMEGLELSSSVSTKGKLFCWR